MKKLVRIIGSVVVGIVLYSVPILHVLSIVYHWGTTTFMLSFAVIAEVASLIIFIDIKSGGGE